MNINKRVFAIFGVVFLLATSFNFNTQSINVKASIIDNKNISNDKLDCNGYIVEFKDEPLLRFRNQLAEKIKKILTLISEKAADVFLSKNVEDHKNNLIVLHRNAREDILNLFGNDVSSIIFSKDFITVFNGILINNIPEKLVSKIKDLPYVKDVFPNIKISVTLDESVPLIDADDVWNMKDAYGQNITGKGVSIAILDTGVNYTHPDLKDNYEPDGSYDFVNNDNFPMDDHGHGTHCAGIALGKGNLSNYQYVGVAPDAKLYVFKILNETGYGDYSTYLAGMEAAVDLNRDGDTSDHVDIVSLSFGTDTPGIPTDNMCIVADDLVDAGVVVVAAAGNEGTANSITSPGCAQKAICVGATDKNDKIASFSSRGPVEWDGNYMVKPDVVAPGVSITSTSKDGGYTTKQGTSMSTPHVAGAAALILQAYPNLTPDEVKDILKTTAVDLYYDCNTQGNGRIDILNVFSPDDQVIIEAPEITFEKQSFIVNLTNKTGAPMKAWVLFTVPFHLPRLKYGSSVNFIAPEVFRKNKEALEGTIKVFKEKPILNILKNCFEIKKEITVINNK
jgi:hypothetical protein